MDTLELLEVLEDTIDGGAIVPFTGGRCMINKEELMELVSEIKMNLPNDLKQAKWIKEERQRILDEAKEEADDIIKGAEGKIISLVNEHEITKQAVSMSNEIMESTKKKTQDMNQSALSYADSLLQYIEDAVHKSMGDLNLLINEVHKNREELRNRPNR